MAPWKVRLLQLFVTRYRPLLCNDPGNRFLFTARSGPQHIAPGLAAERCKRLIWERLGLAVHMHLWRKIMASYLLATTQNVQLVEDLLGHVRGSKSTELYAELQTKWAAARLDRLVEELIAKTAWTGPGTRPRRR